MSESGNGAGGERSVAELVRALSEQSSALARQEMELARVELTEKGKQLGIGAGAFGAAGLIGLFAFGALTATFILLLAEAMEPWIAAAIVTVAYGLIAGVAALFGRGKVQEATPPAPEKAIESGRRDVEAVKAGARAGRS